MTLIPDIIDGFSVAYFRAADQSLTRFPPLSEPAQRATAAMQAFALWTGDEQDQYLLANGQFAFGESTPLLPGCGIDGLGMGRTVLWGTKVGTVAESAQFALQSTRLSNLTLSMPLWPKDDCAVTGFNAQVAGAKPYHAILDHVEIIAPSRGIYHWADDPASTGPILECYDSVIRFGRLGVTAGNSGLGQTFCFYRTRFIGDATMCHVGGPDGVSAPVFGGVLAVVHRGGLCRLIDCETDMTGGPDDPVNNVWLPRCCSVSDNFGQNYPPAGNNRFEIVNLRSRLNPNGSAFSYDLDLPYAVQQNAVEVYGGGGRGVNRGFTYSAQAA